MSFDGSCTNPRLENTTLHVTHKGSTLSLDLDKYLGNSNGTLSWGGHGFSRTTQNFYLDGSVLTAKLLNPDTKTYNLVRIDLGQNLHVVDGKLVLKSKDTNSLQSPSTPPPSYQSSFSERFRSYKSTHKSETYIERSSAYLKFSVDNLRLVGTELSGTCLRPDGERAEIKFDLKDRIGVVAGHLVWGQKGFLSDCQPGSVQLQKDSLFILEALCYSDHTRTNVIKSTLDLSRYLHVFNGRLDVKVFEDSHELSELFSEAKWMNFKVVTEPRPDFLLDISTFKSSFRQLAETAVQHVVAEVTEEFREVSAKHIKEVLRGSIEKEVTVSVAEVITTQVKSLVEVEVEKVFAAAKKEVVSACLKMQEVAIKEITGKYTENITLNMVKDLSTRVDTLIMESMKEVSSLAIAQFQQYAEILMERELNMATLRSAQTQANFLKSLAAQMEGSVGLVEPILKTNGQVSSH